MSVVIGKVVYNPVKRNSFYKHVWNKYIIQWIHMNHISFKFNYLSRSIAISVIVIHTWGKKVKKVITPAVAHINHTDVVIRYFQITFQ